MKSNKKRKKLKDYYRAKILKEKINGKYFCFNISTPPIYTPFSIYHSI